VLRSIYCYCGLLICTPLAKIVPSPRTAIAGYNHDLIDIIDTLSNSFLFSPQVPIQFDTERPLNGLFVVNSQKEDDEMNFNKNLVIS